MKHHFWLFILLLVGACSPDSGEAVDPPFQNDPVETPPVAETPVNPSGSYSLFHGGKNRVYYYYEPTGLADNAPLVFVLHGYNSNIEQFMNWFPMEELADEFGFAVVYPQGLPDDLGTPHWNADLTISTIDDVGFLSMLATYLQETYSLNPEQTFSSGYSNGGFMSYELILKRPDIFKAAASISGTMSLASWNNRTQAEAVPVLQLSGQLDRIVPVEGLTSLYGGWGGAPRIAEIMAFWGTLNQADTEEFIEQDETKITKYINTDNGKEVWYYLIENLGHNIPLGVNYNVHAPSLVWSFFSRY